MHQVLVRTEQCVGCKSCELACSIVHSPGKDLFTAVVHDRKPVRRVHVETNSARTVNLPVQCRHCREPKCVSACMTGAMHVDATTGLVLNREEKCVGCWMCVMVCPYGVITHSETYKVAVKCDQCLSEGHDPACVKACPTRALKFLPVEEYDKAVRREFLSKFTGSEVV